MEFWDILSRKKKELANPVVKFGKNLDFILSIPHSGLYFPYKLRKKYDFSSEILVDTDLFTDVIYGVGGTIIQSDLNPYCVNMNRSKKPVKGPEHLQRHPLEGVTLQGHKALKKPLTEAEKASLMVYYDLYHRYIKEAIAEMKKKHGFAFVLDCHSMNSVGIGRAPDAGKERPDFCIGDNDGKSCSPKVTNSFFTSLPLAEVNNPYKGGFITQKYGDPKNNVHVLQLEIKKSLYMEENLDGGKHFTIHMSTVHQLNDQIKEAVENALTQLRN